MSDLDSPLTHDPIPDQSPSRNQSSPPLPLLPTETVSVTDLTIASTPASSKSSRRLPPPCWSLEETIALIDGYREKWYALNRGNLKANHWEEVAESVAVNCPDATPKKTAVQCRHKMEKLRKRYRTEIQRARSVPVARFISSWVHFKRMEAMENKPETKTEINDDDDDNYKARFQFSGGSTARFFNRNGTVGSSSGGIRIRIPTGVSIAQPGPRFSGKIDANPRAVRMGAGSNKIVREEEDDPVMEIANAIKLLGDTLIRTEQRKMEITKEIEGMRMEMEMKRTKMILESQQKIVEAFAKTISESNNNSNITEEVERKKKKARRLSSLTSES